MMLQRKKFQKSEITMEVGGWIQVSLEIVFAKSSQNTSISDLEFNIFAKRFATSENSQILEVGG